MSNDKQKRKIILLIVLILVAINLIVFGILFTDLSKYIWPTVETPTQDTGKYGINSDGTVIIDDITYKLKDDGNFMVISCDKNAVEAIIKDKINEDDTAVVDEIGEKAFENCIYISNVIIPESITKINSYAFSGCSGLSIITIPYSVTEIGDSVFYNCKNLTSIRVAVSNSDYTDYNGVLYSIDGTIIYAYPYKKPDESYMLSDNLERIENGIFKGMEKLKSVALPDALKSIGDGAFEDCINLEKVIMLKNVTFIGENAFNNCSSEMVFYVEKDSYAENYAKEHGIATEVITYKREEQTENNNQENDNAENNNTDNNENTNTTPNVTPVDITSPKEDVIEIL